MRPLRPKEVRLLILDPAKNRHFSVVSLLSKLGIPEEITLATTEAGKVKGVLVEAMSAAIAISHLSDEARRKAPPPERTELGTERITIGFIMQRAGDPGRFLRCVLNTATGEGVLEACDSPLRVNQGGTALPVSEGLPAGIAVPYGP